MADPLTTPAPTTRRPGIVRSPWGGWGLTIITLGIYGLVWYYKLNSELRDYDPSIRVRPGLAVLSLFVPIVGLVSIYNTSNRVRQAQALAGAPTEVSGVLAVLGGIFFFLVQPYLVTQVNLAWRSAGA